MCFCAGLDDYGHIYGSKLASQYHGNTRRQTSDRYDIIASNLTDSGDLTVR